MKTALHVVGQTLIFAVFLALFFGGSVLNVFHLDPFGAPHWFISHPTPTAIRYFVPTGLLLMTILWLVVVGIEAAARSLRRAGLITSILYLLALIIGVIYRFGWVQPT